MGENIKKQRALHKCNFTVCHNEILFQKLPNGEPLSLDTIGLFWRLMSLPPNWKLNKQGLMAICGCGKNKINSCLDELKQLGYLKTVQTKEESSGCFEPNTYYIFETVDSTLWNTSENGETIEINNENLPEAQNLAADNLAADNLAADNPHQYNMLINKNINNIKDYNNLSESELTFTSESLGQDKNNYNNLTFQILDSNNTNLINQTCAKGSEKGSSREQKAQARREKRAREQEERVNAELNKEKLSVTDLVPTKVSDLTEADNLMANAKKMLNEAREERQIAELKSQKKEGIKKRLMGEIDKQIQNQELAIALKDYTSMWISVGKKMTNEVLNAQLNNLRTITNNEKEQIEIVKRSIQKGWLDLYPLQNKKDNFKPTQQQVKQYETKVKQETSEDAFDIATDDDGNVLVF